MVHWWLGKVADLGYFGSLPNWHLCAFGGYTRGFFYGLQPWWNPGARYDALHATLRDQYLQVGSTTREDQGERGEIAPWWHSSCKLVDSMGVPDRQEYCFEKKMLVIFQSSFSILVADDVCCQLYYMWFNHLSKVSWARHEFDTQDMTQLINPSSRAAFLGTRHTFKPWRESWERKSNCHTWNMDTCSYDIPEDDTLQDGMDIEWKIKKGVPFRGLDITEYI